MNTRPYGKILSIILAVSLLLTQIGVTAFAEEYGDSGVITAFDALTEGVATQGVTLGTSMSALTLPDTLEATVDGAPDSVHVDEWQSEPEYDGDTAGTYIFTAAISGEYTVADGVEPPIITVTVEPGEQSAHTVTIAIAEDENGSTVLYFPRGVAISEDDLLMGVSAEGENGNPVPVTVTELDGLDLQNPQMRSEGYPNPPYIISYAAAHPDDAGVTATTTREVYVTLGAGDIQPTNLNTDLAVGTWTGYGHRWVEFGGILWRVLEVYEYAGGSEIDSNDADSGDKIALLLAENSVGKRQFHTTANNDWNGSDIKAWLNGSGSGQFLARFSTDEQNAIVTSSYTYGGSYTGYDTSASSQVFLLSYNDVTNPQYFEDGSIVTENADRAIGAVWWLRSPSSITLTAAVVGPPGLIAAYGENADRDYAIRPALKINLASGIFTSENPLYETKVSVEDGGSPVAGARISFSGTGAPDAKFSNSAGEATWQLPNGTYNITVTKPGYADKETGITVNAAQASCPVTLTADSAGLPFTLRFGKNGANPLNWQLVDIDKTNARALLLDDDYLMGGNWQPVTNWINDTASGGFLADGEYFTAAEQRAMWTYSETNTKMFLLSKTEAESYFPSVDMRRFQNGSTYYYWLRSGNGSGGYDAVYTVSGAFVVNAWGNSYTYDARPAVWVDLTKLVQRDDSGTITLVPTHTATVTVQDGRTSGAINGATVTLTHTPNETYRLWDGSAFTAPSGTTSGGSGAGFNLPVGTYGVTVSAQRYSNGTGTLTVNGDGAAATITLTTTNNAPTVKTGQGTQTGTATPAATNGNPAAVPYTADVSDWFEDTDGDMLTYTIVSGDADGGVSLDSSTGVLTFTPTAADASSSKTIVVKANDNTADSTGNVTITVTVGAVPADATTNTPPSFTQHPGNQSITEGDNATFTVSASGNPIPTYQWQESTDGTTWNNINNGGVYSGATTNTLTLTGVALGMDGYKYRCLASNAEQSNVTSNAATLTVNTAPPQDIAPLINGEADGVDTIALSLGYLDYTRNYTVTGTPLPTVSIDGMNTAGASVTNGGTLSIPAGLSEGIYDTVIKAENSKGEATMRITVNVTDSTPQPGTHTVIVQTDGNGTAYATPAIAAAGTAISLTAAPDANYEFSRWEAVSPSGLAINENSFTMQDEDVTVKAYFKQIYTPTPPNPLVPPSPPTPTSSRDRDSNSGSSYTPPAAITPSTLILDAAKIKAAIAERERTGASRTRIRHNGEIKVPAGVWHLFGNIPVDFDTTGSPVQVRITVREPDKMTGDKLMSGYVKGSIADSRKAFFEKWFKNKLRVIHFDQQRGFVQPVEIAAKIDLTGMDTENLYFYSYDKKSNTYKSIKKPAYWIDKNGYLHFISELAGDIIISEGPLEKKS